ncbi:hypothetical protein EV702DRAFT_785413 [Suillus placidus]|uniref:Uncharacterized protein n=1 Tax=Suillus placidus TaxID=48579 RepID=A0A9P7CWJ2_9AGAM|nr:hypothetical protein EV702DRAFT_785413 [Suillus placidus]
MTAPLDCRSDNLIWTVDLCQHESSSLVVFPSCLVIFSVILVVMASSSSLGNNQTASRLPPVSFVNRDFRSRACRRWTSVVSSCVLRKIFAVSRQRLPTCNQYPASSLLPVVAPNIVDNFATLNREQYAEIARTHSIYVSSSDRKDHVRDLLRVHVCDAACISNAIVFKLLKRPRLDYSNHFLPEPFEALYRERNAASQHDARATATESQRMDMRDVDAVRHRDAYAQKDGYVVDDPHFPTVLSWDQWDDKLDIIGECSSR